MPYPLTPKELAKKREQLPPRLREVYSSIKTTDTLREIGQEYDLHIDQIGELVDETGLVMLGVTHPSDYISNLQNRLEIDEGTAKQVAKAVNERIFETIREELKQMNGMGESQSAPSKPQQSPPEAVREEISRPLSEILPKQPKDTPPREETPPQVPEDLPVETSTKTPSTPDAPRPETRTPEEKPLNRDELIKEIEGVDAHITQQTDSTPQTSPRKAVQNPVRTDSEESTQQASQSAKTPEEPRDSSTPEKPAQTNTGAESLAEEKLRNTVSIPREKSTYFTEPREEKSEEKANVKKSPQSDYRGTDPYREPVE